jgi:hypothetical protein
MAIEQGDFVEVRGRQWLVEATSFAPNRNNVGQQTDPQSDRPAGAACWPPSPLLEFGLGAGAAAAAPDSMEWSAAPGERSEVRGHRQTRGIETPAV